MIPLRTRLQQCGVLGLASLLALTGCSATPTSPFSEATHLGDADVAVYITQFTNDTTTDGRVLLYNHRGPQGMVSHRGIAVPGLIWDSTGLFFVDQTTDFQLSDELERSTRTRSADMLVGMQAGADGRRVVLFNDGVFDGKNHTGVGVYSGIREQTQDTLLDDMARTFSSCDGGVYSAGAQSVEGDWSQLTRLDPPHGGAPQAVGDRTPGFLVSADDAPCRNGRVVTLGYSDPNALALSLEAWQWDTADGSVQRIQLMNESGRLTVDAGEIHNAEVPVWLNGDALFWVDNTGAAWRTDLNTGMTAKLRDDLEVSEGQIQSWSRSGKWMIQFVYAADHSSAHLNIYSAEDASLVETRELPQLAQLTPDDQMVLAIAVSPDFTPNV